MAKTWRIWLRSWNPAAIHRERDWRTIKTRIQQVGKCTGYCRAALEIPLVRLHLPWNAFANRPTGHWRMYMTDWIQWRLDMTAERWNKSVFTAQSDQDQIAAYTLKLEDSFRLFMVSLVRSYSLCYWSLPRTLLRIWKECLKDWSIGGPKPEAESSTQRPCRASEPSGRRML
jgi:hypothetical protein